MNIYKKLNEAREEFHGQSIKKTGKNTFAGYDYFELSDFILPALAIFKKHGLSGVVSFATDLATLRIVNTEKPEELIEITSPMSEASLKGCHAVQNLGAVQSYLRRYLWVAALEIVEHDAVDASDGPAERKPDVTAILRGISNAATTEVLRANYEAAIQMLPPAHHKAINTAKNTRFRELNPQKETA